MQEIRYCGCGGIPLKNKDVCLECLIRQFNSGQRKPPNHEEEEMQCSFFVAARYKYPHLGKLLFAVPNGGYRRKTEAKRLKRQGVVSGVSDVVLLMPNGFYHFLCMEAKTATGTQTDEQKEFQRQIEQSGGKYAVFRSVDEGLRVLEEYIGNMDG